MSPKTIDYYMLCRDQERIDQWTRRTASIDGIDFHLVTGFASMYAFIAWAIDDCPAPFLLIAHDDVIVGNDLARRVHSLVDELESSFTNWGLVGNAGVDVDGRAHIYVKDPWCVPQQSQRPEPVASIDGNLMLLNRRRFLDAGVEFPDLNGFHGYDVILSLECLRRQLLVLADGRLRAVHLSGGSKGVYEKFIGTNVLQDYFRERFSDRFVPTLLGLHPVEPAADGDAAPRPSLRSVMDAALAQANCGRPRQLAVIDCRAERSMSLCMPTEFGAPPLIEIVTIDPFIATEAAVVPASSPLGEIIRSAFTNLPHDYFWFVTGTVDCDADALRLVAREIASGSGALLIGHCLSHDSTDSMAETPAATALARAIFCCTDFPLSALIVPAAPLRDAIAEFVDGQQVIDGALIGALALSTPGVLFVSLAARIASSGHHESPRQAPAGAYGSDNDWDYIGRSALFNTIAQRANPTLWTLARDTALTPPPSPTMRWLGDLQFVGRAVRQVLRQPGSYLGRGLSLALRYLLRGDLRGLIREARLFRAR